MFKVLALLAVFAAAAMASDVLVLTESNFDDTIAANNIILVEFFAPWCGHCKKLAPEYEKAATTLKEEGIALASVDATEEKALGEKYGVRGYPTLKVFIEGKPQEYKGGRTEDTIVSYMRKKAGPAARELKDAAEVETFVKKPKVAVIGFFAEAAGDEFDNFMKVARDDEDKTYGYTLDAAAATANGVEQPGLVLFKQFDEGKNVFDGTFTKKGVEDFIATNSVPLVIPFSMDVVAQVFQSKIGKVAFLFSTSEIDGFADLATKFKGQLVFATSKGDVDRLNSYVGVTTDDFPKLMILETGAQLKKFPMSGEVTAESMEAHIEAFLAGNVKPWFKSEKAPEDNSGPVTIIVGDNFDEIVMDESKDVLLEVYAPWCGHCKKLEPIYNELGEAYASNPNIVIAKMDGTANEVDGLSVRGFPTLKFYPAGKKTQGGEEYKGGRELKDFKEFLGKNAKSAGHDEL